MVGTELALRVLIGGVADGFPEIATDSGAAHVFDCFALANATLCSAAEPSTARSEGSPAMFSNCQLHLRVTIRILEPTIVIAQGWTKGAAQANGPSTAWAVSTAFGSRVPLSDPTLTRFSESWGSVAVITAYHPAQHWPSTGHSYWHRLLPLLQQARPQSEN